jgi:hypothetical protein
MYQILANILILYEFELINGVLDKNRMGMFVSMRQELGKGMCLIFVVWVRNEMEDNYIKKIMVIMIKE